MNYRNLSKKRHGFRSADGFVVSIPKCGRTWLHFMVQHYHCSKHGLSFELYSNTDRDVGIPNISYTHDLWEHRSAKKILERLKGKFLIPGDCRATKPVLLLTRDLRDVMVSLYFQVTKREQKFSGTISTLLVDPRLGVEATVDIINMWWEEWSQYDRFMHTSYETLHSQTENELARILTHFGESDPDENLVARAVEFAKFENMQRMEKSGEISDVVLTPTDAGDPDSFKVRRGVLGGYTDYMAAQDIHVTEKAMKRLKTPSSAH